MESIKLNFKYSKEEYVNAVRKYLFLSKTITKTSIIILAICIIVEIVITFNSGLTLISCALWFATLLAMVMGSYLYFIQPGYLYKSTSKLHQQYSLIFAQETIYFKTEGISSELKWTIYKKLWDCPAFYYLVQAKSIYTVIPKRVFNSGTELDKFKSLALSGNKDMVYKDYTK